MTRRNDKQCQSFMVPDKPTGIEVWAAVEWCCMDCPSQGVNVVALFDSEQTAKQFVDARDLDAAQRMPVHHAMKRAD